MLSHYGPLQSQEQRPDREEEGQGPERLDEHPKAKARWNAKSGVGLERRSGREGPVRYVCLVLHVNSSPRSMLAP